MDNIFKTVDYKGCEIEIYFDDDSEDPRNWDNLGTMVCSHRRYSLGDEQFNKNRIDYYSSFDELFADYINLQYGIAEGDYDAVLNEKEINTVWKWIDKNMVYAPLYMFEHSGIRIKIGSFYNCGLPQGYAEFDSGQIGFIYASKTGIRKWFSVEKITKKLKDKAMACLESEVETYDDWESGNCYGFIIRDKHGENIDSCWGFYGDIEKSELLNEAKGSIDYYVREQRNKRNKKLKSLIRYKVPLYKRGKLLSDCI